MELACCMCFNLFSMQYNGEEKLIKIEKVGKYMSSISKSNKYEIDMCNGTIMDKLISFSLPLMLSGILQLMFMP